MSCTPAAYGLGKGKGFVLRAFIYSETASGKSLSDAHFTIAMTKFHRYMKETKKSVTTSKDIIRDLHHDIGIPDCACEFVSVRRDGSRMMKCLQGFAGRHIAPLRRVVEFVYGQFVIGIVRVYVYPYSGGLTKSGYYVRVFRAGEGGCSIRSFYWTCAEDMGGRSISRICLERRDYACTSAIATESEHASQKCNRQIKVFYDT